MTGTCRICGAVRDGSVHTAREMMFGFRDAFDYFACGTCGCLQIVEIPDDLQKYYPDGYYAFSAAVTARTSPPRRFLQRERTRYALTGRGVMGGLVTRLFGPADLPPWAGAAGLRLDSRILDVGCGAGHLLRHLRSQGFSSVTGVDPYIAGDISYGDGVRVINCELSQVDEQFDLVMLHHAFEHVADPPGTLTAVTERLAPGGTVLLRMPVVPSYAWRTYGTNWVQLDAPRHLHLHSMRSVELLARNAGLSVVNVAYDSTAFQFWGSEQYQRDIPLRSAASYERGLANSMFTREEIAAYARRAAELNERKDGDQACFLLRRRGDAGSARPSRA